jgi:flagellar hook-associated protein 3 FlgL
VNVNNAMYPLPASWSGVSKLQDQLNTLQQQLASGKKASTLAEMGTSRFTDLSVRSQITKLGAYDTNINTVNLRLNMMNTVLTSLGTINSSARSSSTPGAYGTNNINLTTAPSTAQTQLDQVLSSLNTDLNGHYLFGGGTTQSPPMATSDAAMNGSGSLAGFKTVAAQRLQADQGADGLGRLTLSTTADTTTLAEDGAHPFGFKLASVGTSSPAVTVTQPTGSPASLSVQFTAQPAAGDTVSIGLSLPDGSSDSLTMKAVTGTPQNPGEFQIGATPDDSAANFNAALQSSLTTEGSTKLAVASNFAAANGFFNTSGQTVQRVAVDTTTNSYYAATSFETPAQTAGDTVPWYIGENDATDPRASVSTKVDDSINVNYGVEGNEVGFARLVRSLAVQAIQTYPSSTPAQLATSQAKFDAVANGQLSNLSATNDSASGSLVSVGVDLGLAQTTLKNLSDQHKAYSAQLQNVLSDAELADPNTVASALLQLQTQLQASYSATAMISQLQLANYLK